MRDLPLALAALVLAAPGCGGRGRAAAPPAPVPVVRADSTRAPVVPLTEPRPPARKDPVLPPQQAFLAGMMPLRSTGADTFRAQRPSFDGRGAIIAILDSGVDPGLPGFRTTTTGEPKLLDVRDFSGEGRVELKTVIAAPDGSIVVGGRTIGGFGRVARLAEPPYFGGVLHELPLGRAPAADLNANGRNTDSYAVIVGKSTTGWFVFTDTDGDGSLENEAPVYDYSVSGQSFSYAPVRGREGARALSLAVNFATDDAGRPLLDLVFDNSGHGSHVAGIAGGQGMFGIPGFDGVAPGAQLLGLKIANNARGGISVTGSMLRAMNYAADFAARRGMPLVLNLSFGVGNEMEGAAAIDSLVDEFALKHPGVLLVISAGNDGPGLSTVGFPGSADLALTACAVFPGVFAQPPDAETPVPPDVMGWWSARGGEVPKPDLCAPGVAFSNVPPWHVGEEISGGTSMAAPQLSGLAALLQSALLQQGGRAARAVELKRALMATARPMPGASTVEQGAGMPNVGAAYRWLVGSHQTGIYQVRALADGGNQSRSAAAYRRSGLAPGDTMQRFTVTSIGGQAAAKLLLRSDAPWLRTPPAVEFHGAPETVSVSYDRALLVKPGVYVGTVWARSATDTLGGPVLGLANTIVVPWPEGEPLKVRETLLAGRLARYFVTVPRDGGGLSIRLTVPNDRVAASLYLFEPDGKPHRGGSNIEAGPDSTDVTLRINAEDVVPGVYEVTVLAPPNAPSRYTLEINRPRIAVTRTGQGEIALRNPGLMGVETNISFDIQGVVRDTLVAGVESRPATVAVTTPDWADRMVLDVRFSPALWNAVTDFGLSVFDGAGQLISEGPMNYAFTRQVVKLDRAHRGHPVTVELFPAFAHFAPPGRWSAELRIAFLASAPVKVDGPDIGPVVVGPGASAPIAPPRTASPFSAPEGFRPLLRVTAKPDEGVPSVRQEPW